MRTHTMSNSSGIGKLKAFSLPPKKGTLNKKDVERQKLLEEKEAEAAVLKQFVETFEKPSSTGISFVKGSTYNAGNGTDEKQSNQQIYKTSKYQEFMEKSQKDAHQSFNVVHKTDKPPKKKKEEKKKSNLELFKEELKMMQEEREERMKARHSKSEEKAKKEVKEVQEVEIRYVEDLKSIGSFDTGDPTTTNIYLGNINPQTNEQELMKAFGKYGPLASVKIMWPRTDEERARNRNCGFVAFMNRQDAERAMRYMMGKEIMNFEMKLGWGKAVPLPPQPVYVPPKLLELTLPCPPSGLPFNAQPSPDDVDKLPPPGTSIATMMHQDKENFEKVLRNSVVKVVAPNDRTLLCLIHRMVEFVVKEGPMFEAMIMNREIANPMFRFLFDNQSPAHVYYRWRLFSVLQGEHHSKWRTEEFRMFKDGPLWKPPPVNLFMQGMPEELVEYSPQNSDNENEKEDEKPSRSKSQGTTSKFKESKEVKKKSLSSKEREKLEDILRELTPERVKIKEAMIYCIEHADWAEEIVSCITESLCLEETPLHRKIARLYLVSDILHNCTAKVANVSYFRKGFQFKLVKIFHSIHHCYESIDGRLKAEHFKQRILNCFKAWEEWALYSSDFLIKLQNIFFGLVKEGDRRKETIEETKQPKTVDEDIDGQPIEDEEDIDGVPIDDLASSFDASVLKFKPSKWETIEPNLIESQAMTSSKWDEIEQSQVSRSSFHRTHSFNSGGKEDASDNDDEDDIDGQPMENLQEQASQEEDLATVYIEQMKQQLHLSNEELRAKLREIEVKVLKHQDELESRRPKDPAIGEQVKGYRIRVMRKILEDYQNRSNKNGSSNASCDRRSTGSGGSGSQRSRSRSRSPKYSRKRSHSKSPPRSSRRSPILRTNTSSAHTSSRHHRSRSPNTSPGRRRSRSPLHRHKKR